MNININKKIISVIAIFVLVFTLLAPKAIAQTVFPNRGGTGTTTIPTYGQLLMGNGLGTYSLVATSSLGITGGGGSGLSSITSPFSTINIGGTLTDPTLDIDFTDVTLNDFTNDAGFLTSISGLNISSLTNDSGYLTSIAGLNISDLTNDSGYINSISGLNISDLNNDSGFINSISGLNISDLNNDSGYLTSIAGLNVSALNNDSGYLTSISGLNHNSLSNLTTGDPHTQYAYLSGRSGGQTLTGGTASGNNLTLKSTSNATKGKIIFGNAGTTAYDEVNDRFGIGTASPSTKLHISGSDVSAIMTRLQNTSSAGRAVFQTYNDLGDVWEFSSMGSTYSGNLFGVARARKAELITNTDAMIGTVGSNFLLLGTNDSEVMRLTSGGNVGIGTTTPGQKLSVAGDILGNNIIGSYFTATSTATSTFAWGISTNLLNVTSTTASSTFANGINLTSGCFAISGTCLTTGGGGGATSLEDLTDVSSMTKSYGDLFYWNGSSWANIATSSLGIIGGGGSVAWGDITGTLSDQTDLQTALDGKVDENSAITGATKTKITYDAKGLVTAGADATTADIADSTDKRYVTDAQLTVIGNTSGSNSGDQTSIVGITGTKAEFDTAVTDGNFLYVGDVTQYTAENAQDDVGGIVANSSTVNLTYSDATPSITASVVNDSIGATQLDANQSRGTITLEIDGQGSAITTGAKKAYLRVAYNCTITGWEIVADQTGSIVVDVWKDTYANFAPTVADTITASAKPTLSSAQKAQSSTLTGWTTSLTAGDYLEFNVDSVSTVTKIKLTLSVTRD